MKLPFVACALGTMMTLSATTVLFSDNFNTDNTNIFDAAPLAGRLSGVVVGEAVLRSFGGQQSINDDQLMIAGAGGSGVRFENASGPFGANNRYNWAGGSAGAAILGAGGFRVSFTYTPVNTDTTNWVGWVLGTHNADSGHAVNAAESDYGILFRGNGMTERFDNGTNLGAGGSSSPGEGPRWVQIEVYFNSFADGTNVRAVSWVDGTQVADDTFQWDNNNGEMRMELASNMQRARVDNLTISLIPEPASALLAMLGLGMLGLRRRV